MRKNIQKGFTLIELLVVIAIIGILATIVLTSLGSARTKANDTKVQGQLSSARAQGEIWYSTNGNYGTVLTTNGSCTGGGGSMFTALATSNGLAGLIGATSLPSGYYTGCYTIGTTNATAWAVAATNGTAYNTAATEGWCVDSSGDSKAYTTSTTVVVPFVSSSLTSLTGSALCP